MVSFYTIVIFCFKHFHIFSTEIKFYRFRSPLEKFCATSFVFPFNCSPLRQSSAFSIFSVKFCNDQVMSYLIGSGDLGILVDEHADWVSAHVDISISVVFRSVTQLLPSASYGTLCCCKLLANSFLKCINTTHGDLLLRYHQVLPKSAQTGPFPSLFTVNQFICHILPFRGFKLTSDSFVRTNRNHCKSHC